MLNWILVGNRIRIASETYQALSVTEFFEKRVHDKKGTVGVVAGIAVIFFMIINASAEIIGSGKLLNATFGLSYHTGIIIALCVVIAYTFLLICLSKHCLRSLNQDVVLCISHHFLSHIYVTDTRTAGHRISEKSPAKS